MRLNIRERVKLLAASYPEACMAEIHPDQGRSASGSRRPRRSHLWEQGSYWELERAIDQLRTHTQFGHKWFSLVYIDRTHDLAGLSQRKRWFAEQSLSFVVEVTRQRCDGNIYVPEEVVLRSEFASEAKAVQRPRTSRAA